MAARATVGSGDSFFPSFGILESSGIHMLNLLLYNVQSQIRIRSETIISIFIIALTPGKLILQSPHLAPLLVLEMYCEVYPPPEGIVTKEVW